MGFIFSRLGRYLLRETLFAIAMTLACVVVTVWLIDVVEQLRSFSSARQQISLLTALYLTLLKTPLLIEQTAPFVVLIGTMIGLTRLNRRSELIAIRASGVSAWRFLAPTGFVAIALGVFATVALDPLAAAMYDRSEALLTELRHDPKRPFDTGIWLRQGDGAQQVVIHAKSVDSRRGVLHQATLMVFDARQDGALRFSRRITAAQAQLRNGFWQLENVQEAAPGEEVVSHSQLALPTRLRQDNLFSQVINPSSLSFWRLPTFLRDMRQAGFSPTRYEMRWQNLLAMPLFMAAMAAIGAVFSLRLQRLGHLGRLAAIGASMGFSLYFANRLIGAFATAESVSPVLAAWAPPLAALCAALAAISYAEDG